MLYRDRGDGRERSVQRRVGYDDPPVPFVEPGRVQCEAPAAVERTAREVGVVSPKEYRQAGFGEELAQRLRPPRVRDPASNPGSVALGPDELDQPGVVDVLERTPPRGGQRLPGKPRVGKVGAARGRGGEGPTFEQRDQAGVSVGLRTPQLVHLLRERV